MPAGPSGAALPFQHAGAGCRRTPPCGASWSRSSSAARRTRYLTWEQAGEVAEGSIDLAFSHVVMNQVDDLDGVYRHCARWARPGGWMSHQIDFTSLDTTPEWNGHRRYGELAWKLITGKRGTS